MTNQHSPLPVPERFWSKVQKTPTCWTWTARRLRDGYGVFSVRRVLILAHRWAFEDAYGPVPSGLFVCHHCDTPACVRPDHLFLGTNTDNMRDASAKGRLSTPARSEANAARSTGRTGERNNHAVLTDLQVAEIRRRYAAGGGTLRSLAAEYGVHNGTIGRIVKGQRRALAALDAEVKS